jgi:hypothetical protein
MYIVFMGLVELHLQTCTLYPWSGARPRGLFPGKAHTLFVYTRKSNNLCVWRTTLLRRSFRRCARFRSQYRDVLIGSRHNTNPSISRAAKRDGREISKLMMEDEERYLGATSLGTEYFIYDKQRPPKEEEISHVAVLESTRALVGSLCLAFLRFC